MRCAESWRGALLRAAVASAVCLLVALGSSVSFAGDLDESRRREPGAEADLSVSISSSFEGFLVPTAAVVTVKATSGGKPVKGKAVEFQVYQGPHINNAKLKTKTGADGTASYRVNADGLLGRDTVVAIVTLANSDEENPNGPAANTHLSQKIYWNPEGAPPWESANDRAKRYCPFFPEYTNCESSAVATMASAELPAFATDSAVPLDVLRSFRDDVLKKSDLGRSYIGKYYSRSEEIISMVLRNPALLPPLADMASRFSPRLGRVASDGVAAFKSSEVEEIDQVLRLMADLSSSDGLRADIETARRDLRDADVLSGFRIAVDDRGAE